MIRSRNIMLFYIFFSILCSFGVGCIESNKIERVGVIGHETTFMMKMLTLTININMKLKQLTFTST